MQQEPEQAAGIPEWVVTFGDMMSLLLTFFIMLVSLSEIKQEQKFQAMVESFRKQFGHDMSAASLVPGTAKPRNSKISNLATMGRAKRYNMMKGGDKVHAPVGDDPRVRIVRPGTQTTIGTVLTFGELSIVLSQQQEIDLQLLASEIGGKPQKIEVRGHSGGQPLPRGSAYEDHWELAYRRAKVVAEFLMEDLGIEPRRIRISVAGSQEPYTLEPDPEEQKRNPRVEVYMLDEVALDLSGTLKERDELFLEPPAASSSAPAAAAEAAGDGT
ncbi:MAG: OmpA family protein [Planctomycetales bacterium]|nr:OmpA family protein [Planctomycetales bacterium]